MQTKRNVRNQMCGQSASTLEGDELTVPPGYVTTPSEGHRSVCHCIGPDRN